MTDQLIRLLFYIGMFILGAGFGYMLRCAAYHIGYWRGKHDAETRLSFVIERQNKDIETLERQLHDLSDKLNTAKKQLVRESLGLVRM